MTRNRTYISHQKIVDGLGLKKVRDTENGSLFMTRYINSNDETVDIVCLNDYRDIVISMIVNSKRMTMDKRTKLVKGFLKEYYT